jgi:hypothetical protein
VSLPPDVEPDSSQVINANPVQPEILYHWNFRSSLSPCRDRIWTK